MIGLAITGVNYPLYVRPVKKYREKAAPEIMKLLDDLKESQPQ